MTIKLLELVSQFDDKNDRESERAFFRTQVPWVAPEAYLNIVFKPAPRNVLVDATRRLNIPAVLAEFLAAQNGAILFSGALSIYGIHRPGQMLNRSDSFLQLPFNIELENSKCHPSDATRLLVVGGYGFDGSRVCIDRQDLRIKLFKMGEKSLQHEPSFSWKDLDRWIRNETSRISALFDVSGHRLVDERETLPHPPI